MTDKSRAKVRQVLFRILADAGLLNSTADLQIMLAIPSVKVIELIVNDDPRWLAGLLMADTDISLLAKRYAKRPAQPV